MSKPVQYFNKEYLERCKDLSKEDILQFLEDFRNLQSGQDSKTKLISVRIPENVLEAFKTQSRLMGARYQTRIVQLMREALIEN